MGFIGPVRHRPRNFDQKVVPAILQLDVNKVVSDALPAIYLLLLRRILLLTVQKQFGFGSGVNESCETVGRARPGEWYRLRMVCVGRHFQIYLNDEPLPPINIKDDENDWDDGGVALGGGWLPAEFKDLEVRRATEEELAAFRSVGSKILARPQPDKEATRAKQRESWRSITIGDLPETRGEFSLDGDWLFMPEGKVDAGAAVADGDDFKWHVMKVPAFWTFSYCWLYGEDGFPDLKGASAYRSPSDKATQLESDRLEALTFDWRATKAGWYRQKIELPANIEGRHFLLVFDAIAQISEIWVNGQKVAWNTGMFSQIDCDITPTVKPGTNLVTVHVKANLDKPIANADRAETEAVTVKVTNDMMYSLPRGMMHNSAAGSWQPVRLVVTNTAHVGDVFVQTTLEKASAELELLNDSPEAVDAKLSYEIRDWKDNSVLFSGEPTAVDIPANGKKAAKLETPKLAPKLRALGRPTFTAWS
jgi:hypothetical protein